MNSRNNQTNKKENEMRNKKSKMTITALALMVTLAAFILDFKRELKTSIIINAKPSSVYQKMSDLENYSKWNPFIRSISGNLIKGEKLNVFIKPESENGMSFTPIVLNIEKNKEIRWLGVLGVRGIFDGEHYFSLEETRDAKTKLIHGEKFSGLLVPFFWNMIKVSTKNGFLAHNQALKDVIERNILSSL